MTLADILADDYRRLNYVAPVASAVTTRLTAFINECQEDILSRPGLSQLLHGTITLASVVNQPDYALPPSIARVTRIVDTTNIQPLEDLTEDYYRRIIPDPTRQTGTPRGYALLGLSSVASRPTAAAQVYVASSVAGDTTQVVYFEAVRATGITVKGNVTLNGTTAVSLGSTLTDLVEVTDLYLATAATGVVTLYQDLLLTLPLSFIGIGHLRERFQKIALLPTPMTSLTYTVYYELDLVPLVQSTDEPVLPLRFHRALAIGSRMHEYEFKDDDKRFVIAKGEYDRAIGQMNAYIVNPPDAVYIPGRQASPSSVLGPFYPYTGGYYGGR